MHPVVQPSNVRPNGYGGLAFTVSCPYCGQAHRHVTNGPGVAALWGDHGVRLSHCGAGFTHDSSSTTRIRRGGFYRVSTITPDPQETP